MYNYFRVPTYRLHTSAAVPVPPIEIRRIIIATNAVGDILVLANDAVRIANEAAEIAERVSPVGPVGPVVPVGPVNLVVPDGAADIQLAEESLRQLANSISIVIHSINEQKQIATAQINALLSDGNMALMEPTEKSKADMAKARAQSAIQDALNAAMHADDVVNHALIVCTSIKMRDPITAIKSKNRAAELASTAAELANLAKNKAQQLHLY